MIKKSLWTLNPIKVYDKQQEIQEGDAQVWFGEEWKHAEKGLLSWILSPGTSLEG